MTPEQVVKNFCAAIPKRDVKDICSFFAADAVYHNIPVEPVKGHAAIEAVLQQFIGPATEAEFEMLAIATAGNKVLTERIDRFTIMGKKIEIAVMGTFEVNGEGKITAWRDYFDMAQFTKQMA
jgi:limonene-1,2-epoxide hydrolase